MRKKEDWGDRYLLPLLSLLFCSACSFSLDRASNDPYVLERSVSPGGNHTISVLGIGPPAFPFSAQEIAVQFGNAETALHTLIYNDGGEAVIKEIRWDEDQVFICIGGKEQQDIVCSIDFRTNGTVIQYQDSRL